MSLSIRGQTGLGNSLPATFTQNNIRPGTTAPDTRFKHHLIRRRRLPTWQCLPMRHAENVRVFAS
jgi:hypothetical protein